MKKQDVIKTLHLAVLLILSSICLFFVFTDTALSHEIAINPKVKLVFSLIWITLGISFLFLFLDFLFLRNYKKDFHQLHHAAHSDSMTGIANRYSCDGIIQKYYDSILPDYLGCIMLKITNLSDINHLKGRRHGDMLLREFTKILDYCSKNLCFVGRNGKYLPTHMVSDGFFMAEPGDDGLLEVKVTLINGQYLTKTVDVNLLGR